MSEEIELTPAGWESLLKKAERERDEARIQEDIHLQNSIKLTDLAHRMLAEMEYVQWLSTAAVFRDELEQIKSSTAP